MTATNTARQALAYELETEYGRAYASVLGNMVGLKRRAADFPKTKQKSLMAEAAGMFRALVLILGVERDMPDGEASRLVARHQRQWETASTEDGADA